VATSLILHLGFFRAIRGLSGRCEQLKLITLIESDCAPVRSLILSGIIRYHFDAAMLAMLYMIP